ncbi:MAG: hypothetical protein V7631_2286, partial [Massilia sp.]
MHMRLPALTFLTVLAALPALPAAAAPTPISLDQAMAHPDWIGNPAEQAWWSWDGKNVYFKQKRTGSQLRDTYLASQDGPRKVGDAELAKLDSPNVVHDRRHTRTILVRNGDLFERDPKSGALVQITRGIKADDPQYSSDERAVQFRVGHDWYSWDRASRLQAPAALLRAAKDPAATDADALREMQLRLFSTLKRAKDDRDAARARLEEERRADPSRAVAPVYLGDKLTIEGSSLSPDGRWLVVVTAAKGGDKGRIGKMPRYVTESGYEETDDERTRVGRNNPTPHALKLIDLATNRVQDIPFDSLPGIATDPLAQLRAAAKLAPLKGNRPLRIADRADAVRWTRDGKQAAVMLRAVDNKDRWIATIDLAAAKLKPAHRLTDEAWVNYDNSDFGWLPDNRTLWYLSEESGYAHLYTQDPAGQARALTSGKWEAGDVQWSFDGSTAYMLCNRKNPGTYEVCAVNAKDGGTREVTGLEGVERFVLSPDNRKLLVHYSSSYMPAQLATVPANGGAAVKLTDTRSAEYKQREWIQPEYVAVPSSDGGDPVWSKLYRPAKLEPGKKYPVVMFVHGAGYLQNTTKRFPVYFRE